MVCRPGDRRRRFAGIIGRIGIGLADAFGYADDVLPQNARSPFFMFNKFCRAVKLRTSVQA
jgi:hypothetical protein